jgi:hypothetical protein
MPDFLLIKNVVATPSMHGTDAYGKDCTHMLLDVGRNTGAAAYQLSPAS